MRFGLFTTLYDCGGEAETPADVLDNLREQVVLAEELGFDAVWLGEHHFGPYGLGDLPNPILVGADLAVTGMPGVFAAGDSAAVPDLSHPGQLCAPNAQHAVRQAAVLARNIVAFARGGALKPYRHAYVGSVAGLGHHQGVAQVYRIRLTGFAGWLAHRTYHLFWVPTLSHKARVLADWTLAMFFGRETAQLTSLEHPADDFRDAAGPVTVTVKPPKAGDLAAAGTRPPGR